MQSLVKLIADTLAKMVVGLHKLFNKTREKKKI